MTARTSRRAVLGALGAVPLAAALPVGRAFAAGDGFGARVAGITGRPEFQGSTWGMSFLATDTGETLHAQNPDSLFLAASALKIFIGGTAFEMLGPDHRLRTGIRGTGPVVRGVLRGDLVLVAGGDLLLSGRTRPDGTPAVPDPDHTYPGGPPLPGDPLAEFRLLAGRVRAAGVRRVEGRVVVDVSLFREARESIALGNTMVTVSPMMTYDNVVNVIVTPGATPGAAATVRSVPDVYVSFVNEVRTVATPAARLALGTEATGADGSRTVEVTGEVAAGGPDQYLVYYTVDPGAYGAAALTKALRDNGIPVGGRSVPGEGPGCQLAQLVSPPLSDESAVMLKASSNLHTVAWPYLVGAIAGRDPDNPKAAYDSYQQHLFAAAGLDPVPAGSTDGTYTSTTFVTFLRHLRTRPYFRAFHRALPIMGRDGTLAGNQTGSPAAGHVYAKTGTGAALAPTGAVLHKALAGYIQLRDRRFVAFAEFMRQPVESVTRAATFAPVVQEAMAEIATAAYESFGAR